MADALSESPGERQPTTPEKETRVLAYEPVIGPLEDELFGKRIRKSFGSRAFWGTVVDSYVVGKGLFYKVSFDDGDVDILAAHEVRGDLTEATRHKLEDPSAAENEPEPENAAKVSSLGSATYRDVLRKKKVSLKRRRDSGSSDEGDRIEAPTTRPVSPWDVQLWSTRLFATIMEEDGYIRIQNFVPMANGEKGEMESTGKVKPGDALIAVQGQVVHGVMDHIQACDLIRTLPRPLKLTFLRPLASSTPLNSKAVATAIRATSQALSRDDDQSSLLKKTRFDNDEELDNSSKRGAADAQGDVQVEVPLSTTNLPTTTLRASPPPSRPLSSQGMGGTASQPESSASLSRPVLPFGHATAAFAYPSSNGLQASLGREAVYHQQSDARQSRTPSSHRQAPSSNSTVSSTKPGGVSLANPSLENGAQLQRTMHEGAMHQPQQQQAVHIPVHVPTPPVNTVAQRPHNLPTIPYGQLDQYGHQATTANTGTANRISTSSASVRSIANGQMFRPESLRQYDQAASVLAASHVSEIVDQRNEYNPPPHSTSVVSSYGRQHPANAISSMHYSTSRIPQEHNGFHNLPVRHSEPPPSHHAHVRDSTNTLARREFDAHRRHYHPEHEPTRQNMTLGDYMTYTAQQERLALRAASSTLSVNLPQHAVGARQPPRINAPPQPRAEVAHQMTTVHPDAAHLASSFVITNRGANRPDTVLATTTVSRTDPKGTGSDTSFLNLRHPSFIETTPIVSKPIYATASDEPNYRSAFAQFGKNPARPAYLQKFESSGFVEVIITQPRLYLTLAPMGQHVSVSSFVRGDSGEKGEIESSGKVVVGDILIGIGPVAIPPYMSPSDVARIVASRPRPYAAYFIRPTWEMLQ